MEKTSYIVNNESSGMLVTVTVDRKEIVASLQNLINNHAAGPESEYPIVGRTDVNDYTVTQEARDADLLAIQNVITIMTDNDLFESKLNEIIEKQPRKKNNSFSKGRVQNVFQFDTFGSYWEDSYGTNTPAIRARATHDYELEIVYEEYVVKY